MQNPQNYHLNRYRLLKLIDQGSFSYVYLAEHVYLKTQVAVKIMRMRLSDQAGANFLKEAEIVGRLVHPHIVPVHDAGVEDGIPYIAMAYAPNGCLRGRYPKGSRLAPFEVVHYVQQIADALQYAHSQNIIHRDIKPGNMLLGPNNELWLSDFGLSLVLPSANSLSLQEVAGTLSYMAPEQARGKPGFASDQYSLAAVAYEWLCGRCPFEGSYAEVITQMMFEPVTPLRALNPTISPAIEDVVLKALAKDPQERFATVQSFAAALEAASEEPPTVLSLSPFSNAGQPPVPSVFPFTAAPTPQALSLPPTAEDPEEAIATQLVSARGRANSPPAQVTPGTAGSQSAHAATTVPAAQPARPAPWRPSRRTVIGTLIGFAVVIGVGGGVAAFEAVRIGSSGASSPTPTARPTPASPTPGTTIFTYSKHTDEVKSVAWSPDNRRIASSSADKDETVRLWDATNGANELVYFRHKQEVLPPGKKSNPVKVAFWSPHDGKYIASGDEVGKVHVWYSSNGQDLASSPYTGHKDAVRTLAWSPDGQSIASGGQDNQVQLWHAQTSQQYQTFTRHQDAVFAIAWSPDGKYIVSGSGRLDGSTAGDHTIYVWNVANAQPVTTYTGHTRTVRSVAWSPVQNSSLIASAAEDGTVQVWDAYKGQLSTSFTISGSGIESISWSPDGRMIAAACGNLPQVVVWEVATRKAVLTYSKHKIGLWSVAWSPDGRQIVSGGRDHIAQVWVAPELA